MSKSNGRIWPYAIAMSIVLVFSFCVGTIIVTQKANIQESDSYMTHYQNANVIVNDVIEAQIAFDKQYKIEYISNGIKSGASISYKVTNLDGTSVDNAELVLATSRPETNEFKKNMNNPTVKNGVYTFSNLEFPKPGVWNLIVKVTIGDDYRFYNIKADTRDKKSSEF